MRFAELILRLGTALVAWMMLFAHMLWLAVVSRIDCGPDGTEIHAVLLGLAPVAVVFAALLPVVRPLIDVHRILRWLAVPWILLLPLSMLSIRQVHAAVGSGDTGICGVTAAFWHAAWAPAQLVTVVVVGWLLVRQFRSAQSLEN